MSNNENGKPRPFLVRDDVPIIGQPLTPITWFPTLSIICNCEAKQPVLLVGLGNTSVCPKCGRGFQLFGVTHPDIRNNHKPPHFDINIVVPGMGPDAGEERKPS